MKQQEQLFNVLSLAMLGLTLLLIVYYIIIAISPYSALNPFPPAQVAVLATNTPTATPTLVREVVATWTPTATPTITPTPPPALTPIPPTATNTPTVTPIPPTVTNTPLPTPRVTRSPFRFTYEVTYESPYYGCAWTGVGGFVQDLDGNPLRGYPIRVWGGGIDTVVTSGSSQMYGDSGWEQFFTNQPQEFRGVFRVRLHSPHGDHPPISPEIVLDFPGYCSTALAYVVFTQNH